MDRVLQTSQRFPVLSILIVRCMRRFLLRLSLLLCLFWMVNSAAALWLRCRIPWNLHEKHHWLASKSAGRYSLAVLGSSRAMNNVDAVTLQQQFAGAVINIGNGGSDATDQYLILHQFLRTNSVRIVALQVDYLSMTDYFTYGFRDYIWYCYQNDSEVRRVLKAELGPALTTIWDCAPFVPLMQFGSQYKYFLTEPRPLRVTWDDSLGSQLLDSGAGEDQQFVEYREDTRSVSYLQAIARVCRQHDVRLVLFQSPLPPTIDAVTDREAADEGLRRLAARLNVPLLDYSRLFDDRPLLFCDRHHLYREGALQFSRHLAADLRSLFNP